MELLKRIQAFSVDIYFKMPKELNDEYVNICEQIAVFFQENFSMNEDILKQSNTLLQHLLMIFETRDYIKMTDALNYTVKPILVDANKEN